MDMTIHSKILKGVLTKILVKELRKNVDEACDITVNSLEIKCSDDDTTIKLEANLWIKTVAIPRVLARYKVL